MINDTLSLFAQIKNKKLSKLDSSQTSHTSKEIVNIYCKFIEM